MGKYVLHRILQLIPILLFISIVSFALIRLAPGDPVLSFVTPNMSPEDVERIRQNMGLDQPLYIQYGLWLKNVLAGNFGYSLNNHRPVLTLIVERLPATIGLMGSAFLLSLLVAVVLGLISAVYKNKLADRVLSLLSYIGISLPGLWFALILIYVFTVQLHWLPSMGMRTIGVHSAWDVIKHGIMPCLVLCITHVSVFMRYIRSSTISQLEEDYVQIQYAYGSTRRTVLFRHILRNVLLPVITLFGLSFAEIITGAFIVESIFSWPGMGSLGINAVFGLDYPLIMGMTMMSSFLLIFGNLLADVLYGLADPRIKTMR
ncbi:ABC transporter permease [Paenibacillus chitinolyticus]|uniref:ABC transporter permease n=1 Tax=Paenibacillus chitinolyticus TaxID=79263 RepID=A0A410WPQ9_9BACL|nr:ABC transporter permease [Paenibacillus chitinolyticus]MCY9590884.1 ABC transporter permease [Paenibacillus chitinolyticus]MCY9597315.1 ABC transporter permease [Paenibacillus chitinolyticus]QAV16324.1 ABC transporter permease [Paenibacillus chitinolyticus]